MSFLDACMVKTLKVYDLRTHFEDSDFRIFLHGTHLDGVLIEK
jgi:hypothetical protein